MSSVWIVFAPLADGDEALVNAHWIAQQTAALVPSPTATVMGDDRDACGPGGCVDGM